MAHLRNDEFYLYTGLTDNASECTTALAHIKSLGIPFRHLHYGDPDQIPEVIKSLQTWFPEETVSFPMMTYSECYGQDDPAPRVTKGVIGLNKILTTDWKALTSFTGV